VTSLSCGAELPKGAMFCGECGRATTARIAPPPRPAPSSPARSLPAPVWPDAAQWPAAPPPTPPVEVVPAWPGEVPAKPAERSAPTAKSAPATTSAPAEASAPPAAPPTPPREAPARPIEPTAPGDTVVLGRDLLFAAFDSNPAPKARMQKSEPAEKPAPTTTRDPQPNRTPEPTPEPAVAATPEPVTPTAPAPVPVAPALVTPASVVEPTRTIRPAPPRPDHAVVAPAAPAVPSVRERAVPAVAVPAATAPAATPAVTVVAGNSAEDDLDDLERTRIVPRREHGERFVLQFSTGESVTVHGTGLLGRNPMPQTGEHFDQLVVIADPGKSVSKTHLEFGQDQGAFWVSDRFSGNGSVVREPDTAQRRCEPGKRYRIVRGTRVDIGEQFFVVS